MLTLEAEKQLIAAALEGDPVDFSKTRSPSGERISIRAALLRELLLGLHARTPEQGHNLRVQGVKLRGAIVEGVLDLSDCRGAEGSPLPPLLLKECELAGNRNEPQSPAINAQHARLSRLSLSGSQFACINLYDASVQGDLEIDSIASIKDGQCHVFARQSRIDGSVVAKMARLKMTLGQCIGGDNIPDFALDLSEAEIKGSVILQPDFLAEGGVSVRGARVSGSIWADAAKFDAPGLTAFNAQSLQCDGTVALRGIEKSGMRCEAKGLVDFLGAAVGSLDLCGIKIVSPPPTVEPHYGPTALMLDLARVHQHLSLVLWRSDTTSSIQTEVDGIVHAHATTVGGHLYLSRLSNTFLGLYLRVGGDVVLYHTTGLVFLDGSHIAGKLLVRESSGLYAPNIEIGNDCELDKVSGMVTLRLARIGGELNVSAAARATINTKNTEVRGSVSIKEGTFTSTVEDDALCFDGGNYLGDVLIEGIILEKVARIDPRISVENARIGGALRVRSVSFNFVVLDKWAKNEPKDVLAVMPTFYPGWTLVQALCANDDGHTGVVAFLQHDQYDPVLLTGESWPMHDLSERGFLELNSDKSVLDYLRFFCAHVWGDEGPFTVIESAEDLGGAELSRSVKIDRASIKERDRVKGWTCAANVRYGSTLFQAMLRVAPDGKIEMINDEELAEIKGPPPFTLDPPVRILNVALQPWLPLKCGQSHRRPPTKHDVKGTLSRLGKADILLHSLKASSIKYDPIAESWEPRVKLRLDGFEYERIGIDPHVDQRSNSTPRLDTGALTWSHGARADWRKYLKWLHRQCGGEAPKSREDYKPQPYEQLARVLRSHGYYDDAKRLVKEKLSLERRLLHPPRRMNPILWISWFYFWILEKWFDYGLFAWKSVGIFLLWWLIGTFAFDIANHGRIGVPIGSQRTSPFSWKLDAPVLVVDSVAVNSVALRDSGKPGAITSVAMALADAGTTEVPCGDQIESTWYALDVFVPLLDLKQEAKCSISSREDAFWWRAFKSLYAVIGAIVTSMMLLTVSGVLRRRLEQ